MHYSKKHKEAILKKMIPPNNKTIPQISQEEDIPVSTLYTWRIRAREELLSNVVYGIRQRSFPVLSHLQI